jgi:predicted O-methyltransferase YrrM
MTMDFVQTYLVETGWLRTADRKEAIDKNDRPLPWMTYPAIELLRRIARPGMAVFEFGSGGSTLWWRERVQRVVSVEHDEVWAKETGALARPAGLPCNEQALGPYLRHVEERTDTRTANGGASDRDYSAYLSALLEHPAGTFDIVVIDGMARNTAAVIAAEVVKPGGLVVFDNSDRDDYLVGYQALRAAGLARLDFWGPGPINPYGWCTSIFTRTLDLFR